MKNTSTSKGGNKGGGGSGKGGSQGGGNTKGGGGSGSGGGAGKGSGPGNAGGWPSTTGNPSGGGRSKTLIPSKVDSIQVPSPGLTNGTLTSFLSVCLFHVQIDNLDSKFTLFDLFRLHIFTPSSESYYHFLCYLPSTLLLPLLMIFFCRNLKFTDLTSSSHIVGTE
mmetsp:Transcript_3631/g.5568  ORF Transcript_3631/g.5568 Transcript_3631/m.5568 type:complete len:166 (-) Transcript_3631:439-936(-)